MINKVLVISDNLHLCMEFENIIFELDLQNIEWTFSVSPSSNIELFSHSLKNNVVVKNLKDNGEIDFLCKNYDLILSIHCKQIFPEQLVNSVKCINIHPGYNPVNRGWYPQVFAIINDTKIGATIHEIDAKLDHGNIIDRDLVMIDSWDTSLSLYNKVIELEIRLLRKNLKNIIENSYKTTVPENEGNLYLKRDFNDLCQIDLNELKTVKETLNMLRALTHGDYKNAYYKDESTGKKIYVSVELTEKL
jgi:methionyl-tRNA formyltransferase